MTNGQVAVKFDGVDLDNCIGKGLEFTGLATCPHCNKAYNFRIHIDRKEQLNEHTETIIPYELNGYAVFIDFSGNNTNAPESEGESAGSLLEGECVPCNGCTPNCHKKGR